ncbi:oxidoreductase [Quadrisphaera sp. DSM 44207]|uniref:oxidoreductase n=1 Tax=Quadrisphaera sp. DSM 44207 TaxID=1881057 RepID=UPI000B8691C6|nr:oxidoreductase [Quadrisphaera sp. DSM 44207]
MGLLSRWWRRRRRSSAAAAEGGWRARSGADAEHLRSFAASRTGVEAYVEPATSVTPTTLVLVAQDGEWTRRRVPDPAAAWAFARRLGIPVYDVNQTGYPQRMREHTARRRRDEQPG